jgi:hypothetical protein
MLCVEPDHPTLFAGADKRMSTSMAERAPAPGRDGEWLRHPAQSAAP